MKLRMLQKSGFEAGRFVVVYTKSGIDVPVAIYK